MRKFLPSGLIAILFSFLYTSTCPAAGFLIYNQHAAANASAIAFTAQVDNPAAINQLKGTQVSSGGLSFYLMLNSKVIPPVKLPT